MSKVLTLDAKSAAKLASTAFSSDNLDFLVSEERFFSAGALSASLRLRFPIVKCRIA